MKRLSPKVVILMLYIALVLVALWGGTGWERDRMAEKQLETGIQ